MSVLHLNPTNPRPVPTDNAHFMGRLRRTLEARLLSNRSLTVLGANRVVSDIAAQCGLSDHDFCLFEIELHGRPLCLVCVPQDAWGCQELMERFAEVRIAAGAMGHTVLLFPEALVRSAKLSRDRQAFVDNNKTGISDIDRTTVLEVLLQDGTATLGQLAGMLRHADPIGAILTLALCGAVDIGLDAVVTPAARARCLSQLH